MDTGDLKKTVQHRLVDLGQGPGWLAEQVTKKTGLYCDYSLLKRIYEGTAKSQKIRTAICEILEIEEAI